MTQVPENNSALAYAWTGVKAAGLAAVGVVPGAVGALAGVTAGSLLSDSPQGIVVSGLVGGLGFTIKETFGLSRIFSAASKRHVAYAFLFVLGGVAGTVAVGRSAHNEIMAQRNAAIVPALKH